MDDGNWQVAKRIFAKALAMEPDARVEWVEAECDDEGLRLELLELLAAHEDAGDAGDAGEPAPVAPLVPTEAPGVTIDRYKLLQQIGEGGFGTVYMAAQTEPVERRVALKIIKPGMDSGQVIARFEAERQALALMDHPNIARVLDAGTTASGRPYFVMELVKGIPITEYCEQKHLDPKQRLELFIQVCHGVQHAHQKGIIHRDLKPSNVLIAEYDHTAVPKIIDFGVAKATNQTLTEKTVFTEFGQLIGTFEYMSPEQAKLNQLDIDTRSDVYSLGVLLYELLTGTTPLQRDRLRSAAFDELLRIIREEEPQSPSTRVSTLATANGPPSAASDPRKLSRLLRGDLDWIVMCALDKERDRRYESAGSFADDLERHLAGDIVKAGPPSSVYRLRKFIRRHKGSVAAACALLLMLVLGLAGTSVGLVKAEVARNDAVRARESQRDLTYRMAVDKGLALCDDGQVGPGLLWLARALEMAPPGRSATQQAIRRNLNAWRSELHTVEMVYPHDAGIICVAFHPGGEVLATGCTDDHARLWNLRTGELVADPLRHGGDVHHVAFSADGSTLLTTAMDGGAFLWDTNTGEKRVSFDGGPRSRASGGMMAGAFRPPDEKQVITCSVDGSITIWDAASGQPVGSLPSAEHLVHDVVTSADGKRLLTASHDGTAKLWDLESREILATFKLEARASSADFFGEDDGYVATSAGDGHVHVWKVADALAKGDRTLEASAGEFAFGPWKQRGVSHRMRVSPDRTRILSAAFDSTARILAPGRGVEAEFAHLASVQGAAFHPDGVRVATACNDGIARLWQPAAGRSVSRKAYPVGLQESTYSPGGRYLLTKPDVATAVVTDTGTGGVLCRLEHDGAIRAFAVDRDRSRVLTGSADSWTRIWDASTGELKFSNQHKGSGIWTVDFSPDGAHTIVGDFDGTIEIRDARNGDPVREPFRLGRRAQGVAFSPDGRRIAVVSDDGRVRVFSGGWESPRVLEGHSSTVSAVAFSRDGSRLVTGSYDSTARVWDAETGEPLSGPLRLDGPVFFVSVGFSPDGCTVVAGCNAGTARVWDIASSMPVGPALHHESSVHSAAFTDDSRVVIGTAAAEVALWDVATGPLQGDPDRIALWLHVATGFELDAHGVLVGLDAATWKQRRARLDALGGPPASR
ncbi:MAG: WD40 repeat domain-containing serine/threonine protein kinase [Planctomycetota bacterium]|jgi:WD40 repeat protein